MTDFSDGDSAADGAPNEPEAGAPNVVLGLKPEFDGDVWLKGFSG